MTTLRTARLDNGLTVIACGAEGMTGCAVAVNYRAGFRDESSDRAGFAHLFEHMMFQGSANVPRGEHFAEIQRDGGTVNGNTFTDIADYHQAARVQRLDRVLELEADRMAHLNITAHNLDVQRDVVLEEIGMQLEGRAYGGFPWTVLPSALYSEWANSHNGFGTSEELRQATVQDCRDFYEHHYAPANAALSVCADADPADLLDRVERHFAPLAYRQPPIGRRASEPTVRGERVVHHRDALAPRPAFALGWPLPDPATDMDAYAAFTVLSTMLSRGSGARLRKRLRPFGALADTSVGLFGPLMAAEPDTFVLVVHHDVGERTRAISEVDSELSSIAIELDPIAVRRSVLATVADFYQRLDSPMYRARVIARGQLLFDLPDLADRYTAALERIGADDVRSAASTLAHSSGRGLVLLTGRE
ncbi:M16 family metallopeptidase [Actinomycetes bacterium M1A6_2h]